VFLFSLRVAISVQRIDENGKRKKNVDMAKVKWLWSRNVQLKRKRKNNRDGMEGEKKEVNNLLLGLREETEVLVKLVPELLGEQRTYWAR
jgi:hypothetical protein